MGLLDKLAKAKEVTGSTGGGSRNFVNKAGLWVNLQNGDNIVRLGGNVVVCERHYVVDLADADAFKSRGEDRAALSKNLTCLNWDIDNQQRIPEESQCCPICDLRMAANIRRREAKDAKDKDQEDKMKELSGKSYARSRYSWDAIDRANPNVETTDADGNSTEAPGWKILNLGTEGTEAIEALAKQYPQIADEEEGCDVAVSRHKSTRITYGASFDLDGPNINITPLTDAEKAMEPIDLLRYVASHASPRAVFENMKPAFQELITDVLGKTADDYPTEAPVKKASRQDKAPAEGSSKEEPPRRAAAPVKKAPVKKRAASVADEFEDVPSSEAKNDTFDDEETEEKKPAAPKPPKPPKKPSAPKPPKAAKKEEPKEEEPVAEEAPAEEAPAEEESADDNVHPQCFGYFDDGDDECKKCKDSEECAANKVEE